MLKPKKTMMLSILLIFALTLAACGKSNDSSNGSAGGNAAAATDNTSNADGSDQKPVKLRISWWGSQPRHDATLKALDLYTSLHPNVTFEPEYSGFDGYFDKIATQTAGRNAPDIIQIDLSVFGDYVARNQIVDLTGKVSSDNLDPNLLKSFQSDGKLYALPLGNNATGMLYNEASLEKLGVAPPKDDWTWDDYFSFAREVKSKLGDKQYAVSDSEDSIEFYNAYQASQGKGYAITPDGKFNLDHDTFLDWAGKWEALRAEKVVPPSDVTVSDVALDPKMDLMVNGTVIMRNHGYAAQIGSWDSLMNGSLGVAPVPHGDQAGGSLTPSMSFAVSADSKNAEESEKFISWFVNDPEAGKILGTTRGIPVAKNVLDTLDANFSKSDKQAVDLIGKTAVDSQPNVSIIPEGWSNFGKEFFDTVTEHVFAKASAEEVYQKIVKISKDYGAAQ